MQYTDTYTEIKIHQDISPAYLVSNMSTLPYAIYILQHNGPCLDKKYSS